MSQRSHVPLGRHVWGALLRFLLTIFLKIEVRGAEKLPAAGAGIIYFNHIHWLDPVLIVARLRRYAVPLAKIETQRWPVVGWLLRWYHVIFISRGVVDRTALEATWRVLADGDIVIISPEGTRSPDGRLQIAREGLAFVARRAPSAWLIPCAVEGTTAFKLKGPLFDRPRVTLTYGEPIQLNWPRDAAGEQAIPEGRSGREMLRGMTDEAMVRLAALLPEAARGEYAGRVVAAEQWVAPYKG